MSSRGKRKRQHRALRIRNVLMGPLNRLNSLEAELAATVARKKTIYLDTNHWVCMQSVVLGRTGNTPEHAELLSKYREILSLLEGLVSQGAVCCPVSSELFAELMKQSDERTRRVTARLMDLLSQRVCVQSFLKLARREWRHNVWKVLLGGQPEKLFPLWTSAGFWEGQDESLRNPNLWLEQSEEAIVLWVDRRWGMGFEEVQALPGFTPVPDAMVEVFVTSMNTGIQQQATPPSFEELRRREKLSLLKALKDDFFSEPLPQATTDKLPTTIFSSFVDESDWRILPPLQVLASICAAVVRSRRPTGPHDAADFMHAASGIPYCDAFFCDKSMAAFLTSKPLELNKAYDTVILSRAGEIVEYLKSLR